MMKRNCFLVVGVAALVWSTVAQDNPHNKAPAPGGKVLTTMESGGYTYAEMEVAGKKVWFAGPVTPLKVGDQVTTAAGLPMKGFYSKSLDKTFDMIYFVGAFNKVGQKPAETALPAGHPPIHSDIPADIDLSGIKPLKDGKTVAQVYAAKDQLSGKTIRVRGKAVKVSNAIMGKNWIHLRDGSGKAGSNDLTLTTPATVLPGQLIVAEGTLARNRDFGFGYKYDILIEDASVTVEP